MENSISFIKSVASCFVAPFIKLGYLLSHLPIEIFYSLIGAVAGSAIGGLIVWGVQKKYSEKRIKEKGRYSIRYIAHLSFKNMNVLPSMITEFDVFEFKMEKLEEFMIYFTKGKKSYSAPISTCRDYFVNNEKRLKKRFF